MGHREITELTNRQKLIAAGRGLAEHLEGWSFRPPSLDWKDWSVYLDGPSDKTLEIFWHPSEPTAKIRGVLPTLPGGGAVLLPENDRKGCRIGASIERPPAHLARDISRRLLPEYHEVFQRARQQVERAETQEHSASKLLDELSSLCRTERQTDREARKHTVKLRDFRGFIQAFGQTPNEPTKAKLVLHLPPAVAREVLELVTTRCPELAARH